METLPLLLLQQSIMVLLPPEDVFRVSVCSRALSTVWDAHLLPKLRWRLPRHYPAIRREGLLAHPDLSLTWPENWPEDWRGMQFDPWILAATHGDVELLQFLEDRGTQNCLVYTMGSAARLGHLQAVMWLHQRRTGCTVRAMDFAANNGHLDVVKWLHHNRTEGCSEYAMIGAATCGHLDVVQWLHENRTEGCTFCAMAAAKKTGQTHVIEWLKDHQPFLHHEVHGNGWG